MGDSEGRSLRGAAARVALLAVSSLAALWIGDVALAVLGARQASGHRDRQTMLEVVRELRRGGQDAWPTVYVGNHWQERALFRDTLYPLASISHVTSVMCREASSVVYQSDEHGFTNPPGEWQLAQAELALVGDSYVMGWCVPQPESFASRIRARYRATIVLGHGASGPLSQLGQMREFLPPLRPRHVLWFYYEENDLPDLEDEKGHPILRRYLETGFTQRLAERQAEVDRRLQDLAAEMESVAVRRAVAARAAPEPAYGLAHEARLVLTLTHLRRRIEAVRNPPLPPRQRPCCDVAMLGQVVRAMQATVAAWGGDLTMVVLPSEIRLAGRPARAGIDSTDRAIAAVDSLGVPVLDLRAAIRRFGSAKELYLYQDSHLSARGHQAVGELVLEYLARRDSPTPGMVR